jgi:hypothetical protein
MTVRRTAAALAAILLTVGAVGVAPAPRRVRHLSVVSMREDIPEAEQALAAHTDRRCTDPAGTWLGARWRVPMRWSFSPAATPGYLGPADRVEAVIRRAARNVDAGRNPCGLPENLGTDQIDEADTDATAAVSADGGCGGRDRRNVVSFGPLANGVLAVTCVWWVPGSDGTDGRIVEADIRINDADRLFEQLDDYGGCADRWDLESALTHEFGHAFGLGHVAASAHPWLTMSDGLGPCDSGHRGLGLGDYAMLHAHYGTS